MDYNNFKLIKINENIPNILDKINEYNVYTFKLNDETIGYSLIKKEETNINNMYIYINEDNRSNGYGTILFNETLKVLKNNNYNEIILDININNYQMVNIINKTNSKELTNVNGIKRYVIKL